MNWKLLVVLVDCLFGLSIVAFLLCIWMTICIHKANKFWKIIGDDLMILLKNNTLEGDKIQLLINELQSVTPQAYCARIIFFRNPRRLFGPGIQALLKGGPLCGDLHNERWWNIYEKIYMVAQPYERERIRNLIALYHRVDLEAAVLSLHFDIDAVLDPDRANTKQAMREACEEYDDAMAAQEIMLNG